MNERSIFMEALAQETPAQRAAHLDEACGGDTVLRQRVEALLTSHEQAGSFLGKPIPERLAEKLETPGQPEETRAAAPAAEDGPRPLAEGLGSRIGPFKLLQELGEGGMGTVFLAEQSEPVRRLVALKIIKPGMDSRQVIARFEAERQALALMDHPNIARVLDGGTTETGRPYFVMELVKGVPITKFCDERRLTLRQRLELFVPVCQAVQHAHQKGIIHRDLKPSNVMVCLYDGKAVPKVIDFGIAKATGQKLTERTLFTEIGQVVGTLEYMSPEQAELNQLDIDTRSDIYSLGVLLYELLTGSTPLEKKQVKAAAMLEVLRLIREEEPPRPSTRLSTTDEMPSVAANRGLEPKKLSGLMRGELDWIVMKALEKDRNRRYETANGFAGHVQRYLADEAVHACPPSAAYRLRKFLRRNKAVLTATVLIFLAMVVGTAISTWQAIRATQAGDAERAAREEAQGNLTRATQAENDVRDKLWGSYVGEAHALRMSHGPGQHFGSLTAVRKALQLPLPPGQSLAELRNEAAVALTLPDVEVVQELKAFPGTGSPCFDGALERLARTDPQGNVSVRRVADDSEIVRIPGPGSATAAVLSPDGHVIAVQHPKTMRLMVYRLTEPGHTLLHEYTDMGPGDVTFSPDSQLLGHCDRDGSVSIVTLADGRVTRWSVKGTGFRRLAFRPDGRQVMFWTSVDGREVVQVCDVFTGAVRASLPHPARAYCHVWHPHGRMIATCCEDRKIRLWDTATWRQTLVLEGHKVQGVHCAFSPEGDRLVSNDWNCLLRVWDVQTGRQVFTAPMLNVTHHFSPDGRLAVSILNQAKILRIARDRGFRTLARPSSAGFKAYAVDHGGVALSPDGRLLAVTTEEGSCALVDPASGAELAVIPLFRTVPIRFETSGALLTYGPTGLCRWPVQTDVAKGSCHVGAPQVLFTAPSNDLYGSSADGRVLLIPNYSLGALLLHRDRAGPPVVLGPQEDVRCCAVSPDGRWAATGTHHNLQGVGAKVWDASSGKLAQTFPMSGACGVGFSPDGRWLVTTNGGCRLWAVGTWEAGPVIGKEEGFAFSPDGRVMAVVGDGGVIRLVEPASGREYVRLDAPERPRPYPQCFTPDGSQLIALGAESQALHVWDLRLIRQGLAKMGLDWDAPPYPPAIADAAPLSVTVDLGGKKK